jgi:hypothetical protein
MEQCVWAEDFDGNWDTMCQQSFVFIDGSPSENKMKFCCYCGKELVEKKFQYDVEAGG